MRMLTERVDAIPKPIITRDPLTTAPKRTKEIEALAEELDKGISGAQVSAQIDSMATIEPEPVRNLPPLQIVGARGGPPVRSSPVHAPSPANPDLTQALPPVPWIKVISGPNAGRSVPLLKDETTVGRVGVSVAAIRKSGDGFELVPLEAKVAACINGRPARESEKLQIGDEIDIAGAKLKLMPPRG
jgi:hypothetical protein